MTLQICAPRLVSAVTVEESPSLFLNIEGAVAPSSVLSSWGFVVNTRTEEGDAVWVNPLYWKTR